MAWIESHSILIDHSKVRDVARTLNIKPVYLIGHLHCLWHKVIELREDGDITTWTDEDVAYYAKWDDDPKVFYEALRNRFIDEFEQKNAHPLKIKVVHDWLDYAWKYLFSKYHTSNPNLLKRIEKKYAELAKSKGRPKGRPKGYPEGALPNQPNLTKPDQPNLTVPAGERKVLEERFERFWKAYPKKLGKGNAEKAWFRIRPGEQLTAEILSAVERAKTSVQWMKDDGQFIPYPATWLNRKSWEDEYAEGKKEDRFGFLKKGDSS